jgi:hypothetical protein
MFIGGKFGFSVLGRQSTFEVHKSVFSRVGGIIQETK